MSVIIWQNVRRGGRCGYSSSLSFSAASSDVSSGSDSVQRDEGA